MAITDGDVKKITNAFSLVFDQKVKELELVTKDDIKHLPTKDEYYAREDKTMRELKEIREEITVLSGRMSDHSDRIEGLEKIHPNHAHAIL